MWVWPTKKDIDYSLSSFFSIFSVIAIFTVFTANSIKISFNIEGYSSVTIFKMHFLKL